MRKYLPIIFTIILILTFSTTASAAEFNDVATGSWYQPAITEMSKIGWLTGYADGSFKPEKSITASEFVTITARAAGLEIKPAAASKHWAADVMQSALAAGWYDWDEIPPTTELYDQPISRQLAVKILMRALLPQASGDYNSQSKKISDFAALPGRYYEPVLAAYQVGVLTGDADGAFRPQSALSRAEACTLLLRASQLNKTTPTEQQSPQTDNLPQPSPAPTVTGHVSQNGRLQVIGTQLCNAAGQPIILRGLSSHGLQWYPQFAGKAAIANTVQRGANVFRLAMYTAEGGYISNPALKETVKQAVQAAIQNDIYVIIDWHILSDGNPLTNLDSAKDFFTEMAQLYQDTPNVIYEICNEPNHVSWAGEVRPYAEEIVAAIRAIDEQAIILIGSPTWSQDVHLATANPLPGHNLMYTCHFYAGTHGAELRQRIDEALNNGFPIFISEWGVSRADGSGGVFLQEASEWLNFLHQRSLSWCAWSLCDKAETSAVLRPGTSPNQTWSDNDLTEAGLFIFSHIQD